jgi:hypothetical protein
MVYYLVHGARRTRCSTRHRLLRHRHRDQLSLGVADTNRNTSVGVAVGILSTTSAVVSSTDCGGGGGGGAADDILLAAALSLARDRVQATNEPLAAIGPRAALLLPVGAARKRLLPAAPADPGNDASATDESLAARPRGAAPLLDPWTRACTRYRFETKPPPVNLVGVLGPAGDDSEAVRNILLELELALGDSLVEVAADWLVVARSRPLREWHVGGLAHAHLVVEDLEHGLPPSVPFHHFEEQAGARLHGPRRVVLAQLLAVRIGRAVPLRGYAGEGLLVRAGVEPKLLPLPVNLAGNVARLRL